MTKEEMKAIGGMMAHHVGVVMEDVQHKFVLLAEGHQMMADKLDRLTERVAKVEDRLTSVEAKVDAVAVDLAAHRKDTEAHRGVYRVSES